MFKKLPVKLIVILFCIAFHSLNTQAGVFKPVPGDTIQAESIINAIDRGDSIIIDNCKILGPLIKGDLFGRTDTIKSFIGIVQSTFSDRVSFTDRYFKEWVLFCADSFIKNVEFVRATFGGDADFTGATFHSLAYFSNATFSGDAYFLGAAFGGKIYFWKATFGRDADFSDATFDSLAYSSNATFSGDVHFNRATFGGDANFWDVTFGGEANFSDVTFGGDANFSVAAFAKNAYFIDTKFQKKVDLSPKEFKTIYISWEQLRGHLVYNRTGNYKLMKYFEEQRMLEDADGIFLFIKDNERMEKHPLIRYPEYWFVYLTCGYGRRPLNTLVLSIGLIILFAILYTRKPNAINEIQKGFWYRSQRKFRKRFYQNIPKGGGFYYALYFSLHTFIIGVVSDWHASDEFLIGDSEKRGIKLFRFRTLSMIEGALGWILVIILIICLERTIGR